MRRIVDENVVGHRRVLIIYIKNYIHIVVMIIGSMLAQASQLEPAH